MVTRPIEAHKMKSDFQLITLDIHIDSSLLESFRIAMPESDKDDSNECTLFQLNLLRVHVQFVSHVQCQNLDKCSLLPKMITPENRQKYNDFELEY